MCVDEAKELLQQFSKLYLKNYGATVFEKIKEEHSSKKDGDEELKLKYRPVNINIIIITHYMSIIVFFKLLISLIVDLFVTSSKTRN